MVRLRAHLEALLAEANQRNQQRFDAQERAVAAALQSQKEAVVKAEVAADKRFDLINELRVGIATRDEVQALEKIVSAMRDEVTSLRSETRGGAHARATLYTIGGLVIAALSVATLVVSLLVT